MRSLSACALVAAWAGLLSVQQQPTFRARTDLVSVDVLVTADGQPVTGLTMADFEVRDNGVSQTIAAVSVEQVPLDVVLVCDTSQSMANVRMVQLLEAARGVLDKLRADDRAALITFSDRVIQHTGLTSDRTVLRRALERPRAMGRTSMFDALYAGLALRRTAATRAMVLLFTDGKDNASWLEMDSVRRLARESDVVVYGVGLDPAVRDQLGDLAEETGGELLFTNSERQLKALFVRVLGEMQSRYLLTYYPNGVARAGWHSLDVRVPGGPVDVKARRGYLVSPESGLATAADRPAF